MGELIVDLFISLDGHARGEGAPAYFGYPGPDLEHWIDDNLAVPQVLLMGRVTYEAMSALVRDQHVEGRNWMNELPKVVFSGKLREPLEWNNSRLAKADIVEEVRSLKSDTDERLVSSTGLMPTFLELAGTPTPGYADGRSLVPLFSGRPPSRRDALLLEGYDDRRTYVEYETGEQELYDLRGDPRQLGTRLPEGKRQLITE